MFPRRSARHTLRLIGLCCLLTGAVADGHNPMSAPAAGETIYVGRPYTIRWSPGTSGPVFIALLDNEGQGSGNITTSTSNTGTFSWTPQPELATYHSGIDYFLQICAINGNDCTYTYNGRFSLSQAQATSTTASYMEPVIAPPTPALSTTSSSAQSQSIQSSAASSVSSSTSPTSPSVSASSSVESTILQSSQTTMSLSAKLSSSISPSISELASRPPSTSTVTSSASSAPSILSTANEHSEQSGLPVSTKIAIGVVISILGTILLMSIIYLIVRKRGRKISTYVYHGKAELGSGEKAKTCYEMPRNEISELSSVVGKKFHELESPSADYK